MNAVSRDPKNKNPSAKEHAEWDFALYMDIPPGVSSLRM